MSEVPSWLNEENIATGVKVSQNPAAQKAAMSAAKHVPPPPPPPPKSGYVPPDSRNDLESNSPTPSSAPAHDPSSEFVIEEATLKSMQNWHLALRLCYMAAAIFMGVAAGLSLQSQKNLGLIFFALYVLFFCAMICCFEFNLQMVASSIAINFGFMYTLSGRMIFLLFVGFMSFSLGTLGIVAMCVLYAVGLFHGYLMYKFPRFEEYLRKKHYYEGKQASQNRTRV